MQDIDIIKNEIGITTDLAKAQYMQLRDNALVRPDVEYPEPHFLLSIGDVPTLPTGNLTAITAKWKSGKTFLCDLLCAAVLGSTAYEGIRAERVGDNDKVLFFDTEQDVSDTARIIKVINTLVGHDIDQRLELYCLRNLDIEADPDGEGMSRYEFVAATIAHSRPVLVVIDGIADLIYNYNDVIESQTIVNRLSSLASQMGCVILVVMHQNKNKDDKNMKGHIGTMLYQKCSDVFSLQRVGDVFAVHHDVSRHRPVSDFYFVIGENGAPTYYEQGLASRVVESTQREQEGGDNMLDKVVTLDDIPQEVFEQSMELFGDTNCVSAKRLLQLVQQLHDCSVNTAYQILRNTVDAGIAVKDGKRYKFN